MKPLVLALLALAGCTSTRLADLSSPATRAEVNGRAERGHPVLYVAGQRGRQVRALHVAPDVTTWTDKKTGEAHSAPTSEVEAVAFRRDGWGALQGVGIGIATGAAVGAIVGATDGEGWFTYSPALGALLCATAGAEIGLLAGAIRSDRVVYEAAPCPGPPLACAAPASAVSRTPASARPTVR